MNERDIELRNDLSGADRTARLAALDAVVQLGDAARSFLPDLIALLRAGDRTAGPTARALARLERLAEPAIPHLAHVIRESRNERVVRDAIGAIRAIGVLDDAARSVLEETLRSRTTGAVARSAASLAWVDLTGDASLPCESLRELIEFPDYTVQWPAVRTAGELGAAARALVDAIVPLLGDETWMLREKAAEALGRIGDAGALDALRASAGDEDEAVRLAVAAAIERLQG